MRYSTSLCEGCVPTHWKAANVIPVPKTYLPWSISCDLRPIALTAMIGKISESFVGNWILKEVENNLDGRQYGGLKSQLMTHALVDLLHHNSLAQCCQMPNIKLRNSRCRRVQSLIHTAVPYACYTLHCAVQFSPPPKKKRNLLLP